MDVSCGREKGVGVETFCRGGNSAIVGVTVISWPGSGWVSWADKSSGVWLIISPGSSALSPWVTIQKADRGAKLAHPRTRMTSAASSASFLAENFLRRRRVMGLGFCRSGSGGRGTSVSKLDSGDAGNGR